MDTQIDILNLTQQNFIKLVDSVTEEQFNKIPAGFGNNIIWNFAHIIASLQMLCYVRSGFAAGIDESFVQQYKNGSKPETHVSIVEYTTIKGFAELSLIKFKEDYTAGLFNGFKPFTTMSGLPINNIDTALEYVIMHHGLHLGYAMVLKKLVC